MGMSGSNSAPGDVPDEAYKQLERMKLEDKFPKVYCANGENCKNKENRKGYTQCHIQNSSEFYCGKVCKKQREDALEAEKNKTIGRRFIDYLFGGKKDEW